MHIITPLGVSLLSVFSTALANSCVWLDTSNNNSTVAATGYSPCTSSSTASTCCADSDACLSNGYCSGSFGLYRGACTDWSAGVCPDTCADLTFVSQGTTYYLANLYRCNGQGREIWWCGDQSRDTTAQPCQSSVGTTFSMTSIGTFITPVPLVAAATVSSLQTGSITGSSASTTSGASSTSTTSAASTSAANSTASPSSKNSSALGIGLGVGLGVPLLAAIIALTYVLARRKGNMSTAAGVPERQQMLYQQPQGWSTNTRPEELHGQHIQEISGTQRPTAELGGREK